MAILRLWARRFEMMILPTLASERYTSIRLREACLSRITWQRFFAFFNLDHLPSSHNFHYYVSLSKMYCIYLIPDLIFLNFLRRKMVFNKKITPSLEKFEQS